MKISFTRRIFVAETVGTFGLVVAATGSIVYDAMLAGVLGLEFVALAHMAGLWILVTAFGRYSMAHFNPAVTLAFVITGHAHRSQIPTYLVAQTVGAISGSVAVLYAFGYHGDLGLNQPDVSYGIMPVFGIETAATIMLVGAILCAVKWRPHAVIIGLVVGGVVALDVWFFGPISGASMNPIRSLAPAVVTGIGDHLWLYFAAPLLGALVPSLLYRRLQRSFMSIKGSSPAHT